MSSVFSTRSQRSHLLLEDKDTHNSSLLLTRTRTMALPVALPRARVLPPECCSSSYGNPMTALRDLLPPADLRSPCNVSFRSLRSKKLGDCGGFATRRAWSAERLAVILMYLFFDQSNTDFPPIIRECALTMALAAERVLPRTCFAPIHTLKIAPSPSERSEVSYMRG